VTAPLKMKDLEARTGVSREAIHFYFREGLLPEPDRPKKNVAHYTDEHVVRIRAIKQLQHERALPLEAIKPILERFDYDAYSASNDLARFEIEVHSRVDGDLPSSDQRVDEVAARLGLYRAQIFELNKEGVIRIKGKGKNASIDFRDVGIVETWAKFLHLGFGNKSGYDAAYAGRFAKVLTEIAELEVGKFLDVFGENAPDDAAELAAQGIAATNDLIARLRTQALMRALHERVPSEG